jgi:glycosyltransferase involved in cell wall biosynthesis
MLEAMSVGCFPIQSNTSMGDEWLEHGVTGFLVSPVETGQVAAAIREALVNDRLVDEAAPLNMDRIEAELQYDRQRQKVLTMYQQVNQN